MSDPFRVAHPDDLERVEANAHTAEKAGDRVIERHTEDAGGAGRRTHPDLDPIPERPRLPRR